MKISPHRYEVIGTIGSGATSRVDKARDAMIGRTVALKTFLRNFGSGDLQKQFLREAQIIGRLSHPNIVGLFDVGVNGEGAPYLVMEYVEGKTLEATLVAGPLPLERAAVWGMDLAAALARAQQCNIIHGDVKPANVLITKDGQVKLGDFGIAQFATQMSGSGRVLGTPAYLSPEQIQGQQQDARSDLFSLGIMLYEMTTGLRPFNGTSIGAVCAQIVSAVPAPPSYHNPALPLEFDHVVMRCLAKNPENRYTSAEALSASLYPFAHGKTTSFPLPPRSWWERPMQGQDLRAAAVLLAVLGVLGVGARALVDHHNARKASASAAQPAWAATPASAFTPGASADSSAVADLAAQPSSSLINVRDTDLATMQQQANPPGADVNVKAEGGSSTFDPPADFSGTAANEMTPGTDASQAFERHIMGATKSTTLHFSRGGASAKTAAAGSSASAAHAAVAQPGNAGTKSATVSKSTMHVDLLASVADETLSVYADKELLLSTPLQTTHLGDTLRFDCQVEPGEHAFRVVLTRPDDSIVLEKDSTSEIRPNGTNFLGIHVTRRAKLLVKHEVTLEVVWPSTGAPVLTPAAPKAADVMASR
jgi:serine/threonine protein kinase